MPTPARDQERRECVLKLARENPRWGYPRIQGEALKLGFQISRHVGRPARPALLDPLVRPRVVVVVDELHKHALQVPAASACISGTIRQYR